MQTRTIEFLPTDDFKVLKVIQVEGHEWHPFTGYLPYLRKFVPKVYNEDSNDLVDEKILEAIKHNYPKSSLRYSDNIVFKGQLMDQLKRLEGGTRKKIEIRFSPHIPYEMMPRLVNREFYIYPWKFELRLLFNESPKKKEMINGFFLCSLPFEQLDELVKTIEPV